MEETEFIDVQAKYPKKQPTRVWDPVHIEYPVRKFPETGVSSETIGHDWRPPQEVLSESKHPLTAIKEYYRDYNIERDLMRSQSTLDYEFKHPETQRFLKNTPCTENLYIYPPVRKLADRPPQCRAHGTSEMRDKYKVPEIPARLVTEKQQFMHPMSIPLDPPALESSSEKDVEPIYTTDEGFAKYLDPYLTTSRLHHRPFTADQLSRESNLSARNIVTYYTFSDTPMTRTPKKRPENWRLPLPRPKSMYDREKFKQDIRDIRTHTFNKPKWVPGSFRTEIRDNFSSFTAKPEYRIHNPEEDVQSYYQHAIANLPCNKQEEHEAILQGYSTANSVIGSKKPLCSILDVYPEKNKRLELRENKCMHKV